MTRAGGFNTAMGEVLIDLLVYWYAEVMRTVNAVITAVRRRSFHMHCLLCTSNKVFLSCIDIVLGVHK